jgi:hypothetical protein
MGHLKDRPECADLVEELRIAEAKFNRPVDSSEVVPAPSASTRAT